MTQAEKTPLFTHEELVAAFTLLLPEQDARSMAARWWEMFADEVDASGRYVYFQRWGEPRPPEAGDELEDAPEWHTPERIRDDEALLSGWGERDAEGWLLGLRDLHLALLAILSDELYRRMRAARQISPRGAARSRLQLTRAVRAYREARNWPPAV
jgi:hypothetical protein